MNTKKKQQLSPFEMRKEIVLIDPPNDFVIPVQFSTLIDTKKFQVELYACLCLKDQIKVIQAWKGKFKHAFVTNIEGRSWGDVDTAVQFLLQLYLLPKFFPLRSSLEWIVESLLLIKFATKQEIAVTVRAVCVRIWEKLRADLNSHSTQMSSDSVANEVIGVALSFNCMSALDSHFGWLGSDASAAGCLNDNDSLYQYLSFLTDVLSMSSYPLGIQALSKDSSSSDMPQVPVPPSVVRDGIQSSAIKVDNSSAALLPSSELLKYVEGCGESIRAIMAVLKTRRNWHLIVQDPQSTSHASEVISALTSPDPEPHRLFTLPSTPASSDSSPSPLQWGLLVDRLMSAAARVLCSSVANRDRDVLTSTAMGVMCVQRLLCACADCQDHHQHHLKSSEAGSGSGSGAGVKVDLSASIHIHSLLLLPHPLIGNGVRPKLDSPAGYRLHPQLQSVLARFSPSSSPSSATSSSSQPFPALSHCALVKAAISLYGDLALLAPLTTAPTTAPTTALTATGTHAIPEPSSKQMSDLISLLQFQQGDSEGQGGNQAQRHRQGIPLLLGPIFTFVIAACTAQDPVQRLYGFQTLEAWLSRVLALLQSGALLNWGTSPTSPPLLRLEAYSGSSGGGSGGSDGGVVGGGEDDSTSAGKRGNAVSSNNKPVISAAHEANEVARVLLQALCTAAVVLSQAWSHPSRQVRLYIRTLTCSNNDPLLLTAI